MPNDTVRASATALPIARKTNMTIWDMREDLDEVRDLIEAVSMAAADVPPQQGGPMRTLLSLITAKLDGVRTALEAYRGETADV
jgi:hypothetical protein